MHTNAALSTAIFLLTKLCVDRENCTFFYQPKWSTFYADYDGCSTSSIDESTCKCTFSSLGPWRWKKNPSASPAHTFITIKWPSSSYERFCHDGGAVSLTDLEMMSSFLTQVCKCCRLMLCKVCKVSTVLTDNTKAWEKKCQYQIKVTTDSWTSTKNHMTQFSTWVGKV